MVLTIIRLQTLVLDSGLLGSTRLRRHLNRYHYHHPYPRHRHQSPRQPEKEFILNTSVMA